MQTLVDHQTRGNAMPANRTRKGRAAKLDLKILALLAVGMGMNSVPDEEITRLWKLHGKAVTDHCERHGWGEPFCRDFGVEPKTTRKKK